MLHAENIDLFYGASQALKSVNLDAVLGQVTCVMGRNGVGKTSLMRAVVGQQAIQSGSITWDGEEITHMAPYDRARKGIAFVPQGREIFPLLTVEENLQTGYAPLPRPLRHIQDEIFELFPVLKDMLGRRGGDLSGGQQQQLAIARALVTRPRLLVLDEPTEGIQPSIIKDIERVIRLLGQRGDMAIVLVEQYFEFARDLANTFIVMDRGEVVMQGTRAQLVEEDVRRYLTV
ncbi:urea ABC transporter ATP-binding subunit UrtE [Magnetospira thiophila]